MFVVGVPLIIAIVLVVAWASKGGASRRAPAAPGDLLGQERSAPPRVLPPDTLGDDLARWVAAGLIGARQADAIVHHERARRVVVRPGVSARRRGVPSIAEALGYLGGVLAIVGLVLLVGSRWVDIGTAGRLLLSAAAAMSLLVAGALVQETDDPPLDRLRQALWLVATAASALLAGVVAVDVLGIERATGVAALCAAELALLSGVLWWWRGPVAQQATCLAGIAVFVGSGVSAVWNAGPAGIAVWLLGVAYLVLGLRRRIARALLAVGAGAVATVAGAAIMIGEWQGASLLAILATGLGLVGLASVDGPVHTSADRAVLGVIGGVALLQAVPSTLAYFSQEAGTVTGLAVWAAGWALTALASHRRVRSAPAAMAAGGLAVLGGAALVATQATGFATILGIASAVALIVVGMAPGRVVSSMLGSLGLLAFVPWAIVWFFPGEGRAPLALLVAGVLFLVTAVLLTRMGGRLRTELSGRGAVQPPAAEPEEVEGAIDRHPVSL